MDKMQNDIPCIKFIEVPDLATAKTYTNGFIFHYGNSCASMLGKTPGYTPAGSGYYQPSWPEQWQGITLSKNCAMSEKVVQHEVLHGMGVQHEHERSDRDEYITYNEAYAYDPKQYEKMPANRHNKSPIAGDLEIESVMTYDSYNGKGAWDMVLKKTGQPFSGGSRMTTSDALQMQWWYCNDLLGNPDYKYKVRENQLFYE